MLLLSPSAAADDVQQCADNVQTSSCHQSVLTVCLNNVLVAKLFITAECGVTGVFVVKTCHCYVAGTLLTKM